MNLITSILQEGILHVTWHTETFVPLVGENSSLVVYARVSLVTCGGAPCWLLCSYGEKSGYLKKLWCEGY